MSLLARSAIKKIAFQFRKITPILYKDVMHHLHNIQHPPDPFTKEFCECLRSGSNEYVEHFVYKTLKDDLSFVIYNKDKKVAGLILNCISRPWDINESDLFLKLVKHQNLHEMLCRKGEANKNFNLFKEFDVKQIFEIRLLSLDLNFNENVLSKHLLYMTEILARNRGFKLIKADTFSDFLRKQLKGKGFQSLNENFKDVQKSPVNFQIMYKKLEND